MIDGVPARATGFDPAATRPLRNARRRRCRSSASAARRSASLARRNLRRVGARGVRCAVRRRIALLRRRAAVRRWASPSIGSARACGSVDRRSVVLSTKVGRLLDAQPGGAAAGRERRRLSVQLPLRLQLRRHAALARAQPAAPRHQRHRHRADPRRQPALAGRPAGAALRRGDERRVSRAARASRGRRRSRRSVSASTTGASSSASRRTATSTASCWRAATRCSTTRRSTRFLPECARRGIGVLMAAPFNSGILATGARPGATYFYQPAEPEIAARVAAHRGGVRAARRGHRRRGAAVSARASRGRERRHRHGQPARSGAESRPLPRGDSRRVLGRDEARRTDRRERAGSRRARLIARARPSDSIGSRRKLLRPVDDVATALSHLAQGDDRPRDQRVRGARGHAAGGHRRRAQIRRARAGRRPAGAQVRRVHRPHDGAGCGRANGSTCTISRPSARHDGRHERAWYEAAETPQARARHRRRALPRRRESAVRRSARPAVLDRRPRDAGDPRDHVVDGRGSDVADARGHRLHRAGRRRSPAGGAALGLRVLRLRQRRVDAHRRSRAGPAGQPPQRRQVRRGGTVLVRLDESGVRHRRRQSLRARSRPAVPQGPRRSR